MDYQYKSICRGEHSIFGQISAQGIDPRNHIFFFNLRSYDRLNKTPKMVKQEELSGVKYQNVQRAEAEEIMGEGVEGAEGEYGAHRGAAVDISGNEEEEEKVDHKRKFEASQEEAGLEGGPQSSDTIAKDAMFRQGKVSDEPWEGDAETEKENFVQEELYIHAKVSSSPD